MKFDRIYLYRFLVLASVTAAFFGLGHILNHSASTVSAVDNYLLLPDKVSRSAPLVVKLPESVPAKDASWRVTFNPALFGSWSSGSKSNEAIFTPSGPLVLGTRYAISLSLGNGFIRKDFLADVDPDISAVFPSDGSEANEYAYLTIVFNRPMIPLSRAGSLDRLPEKYVHISPTVPGEFRWLTTKTLQFHPSSRFKRSSRYTISISGGWRSPDGLAISPRTVSFATRSLHYENVNSDQLAEIKSSFGSTDPIRVFFNQPVDLNKTQSQIELSDISSPASGFPSTLPNLISTTTLNDQEIVIQPSIRPESYTGGTPVPFVLRYAVRNLVEADGREHQVSDPRILEILPKSDGFGRSGHWQFEHTYVYHLKKAYPAEGDIDLNEDHYGQINIKPLLYSVTAESNLPQARSLVYPDVFDPQAKLWLQFSEAVDRNKLSVSGYPVNIGDYAERCATDSSGNQISFGEDCDKEKDLTKISLTLANQAVSPGTEIHLKLDKVANAAGLTLNSNPVPVDLKIHSKFKITKVDPAEGATKVSPTQIRFCSNTPPAVPDDEDFYNRFRFDSPVGRWSWSNTFRTESRLDYKNNPSLCALGEYESDISIGLPPEQDVKLSINVKDIFGQTAEQSSQFKTDVAPESSRNFFAMQSIWNVTSLSSSTLTYAVENLPYVNLSVCRVSALSMLRLGGSIPSADKPTDSSLCLDSWQKTITLPKRFWTRNYFQIKLSDLVGRTPGHYILTFTHPDHRRVDWVWSPSEQKSVRKIGGPVYERTFITLTNLAAVEKKVEWQGGQNNYNYDSHPDYTRQSLSLGPTNLYWVSSFGSLAPVENAKVEVFGNDYSPLVSGLTDQEGIAHLKPMPGVKGAIISSGNDSTVLTPENDRLNWVPSVSSSESVYIYSDRPIYRPGQTVHLKGIDRIDWDGNYEILSGKSIPITIRDPRGEQIISTSSAVSSMGTFAWDLNLDSLAPSGTYSVQAGEGWGSFDVESYAPAAFQVNLKSKSEEYKAGQNAEIKVGANYYFGVPLSDGEAEYSLTSQDYYFDRYSGNDFSFGRGWYYGDNYGYGDKFHFRRTVKLSSDGTANISLPLNFEELFPKESDRSKSKIFTLEVNVKNSNGQAVSERISFIVHRADFYLGLNLNPYFVSQGKPVKISVKSVDTKGNPMAVNKITAKLIKLSWSSYRRQEVDGHYYYGSEEKTETIKSVDFSTDSDGNGSVEFTPASTGEYRIEVSASDSKGNPVLSSRELYVSGSDWSSIQPENNATLDIAADQKELKVGGTADIVVKSPFAHGKILLTMERGSVYDYQIAEVNGSLAAFHMPVKSEYVPNVTLSAILLSPDPALRYGQVDYPVNTSERELKITAKTDKDVYLPGETVHLSLESKDKNGTPAPAELSVAVADLSVLALSGNPHKNPLVFFYGNEPLTVTTAVNVKNILTQAEIPTGTKGGAGGGEARDELAKKKRGDFRDTAFWRSTVQTDRLGRADLTFTLPDNLTTWQLESVGVTSDTKLGVTYSEFKTRKDLMVVPLAPRFFLSGDSFSVGAKVFNQTDHTLDVSLTFNSSSSSPVDGKTRALHLPAGGSDTVYYSLVAPSNATSAIFYSLKAESGNYADEVEQKIPLGFGSATEFVADSGYTVADTSSEYVSMPDGALPERGGLKISVSGSLAGFLSGGFKYLLNLPYYCSEQIAVKLSAVAEITRAQKIYSSPQLSKFSVVSWDGGDVPFDDAVKLGLSRLSDLQTQDGGFAFFQGMAPEANLTQVVLNSLLDLRDSGYSVPDKLINQAAQYLVQQVNLQNNPTYPSNYVFYGWLSSPESAVSIASVLSRLDNYPIPANLQNRLDQITSDSGTLNKLSSHSLAQLAALNSNLSSASQNKIWSILDNRTVVDGRGAHLSELGSSNYALDIFSTPTRDTADYVLASAKSKRNNSNLPAMLLWLNKSRGSDGSWGSTENTLAVLKSYLEYISWKQENSSNLSVFASLDGVRFADFEIKPDNVFDELSGILPISQLGKGELRRLALDRVSNNKISPNGYYYNAELSYALPPGKLPAMDEGITITREFFHLDDPLGRHPLASIKQGDVARGHLTITVPENRSAVSVEDFIPAGTELVNFNLATTDQSLLKFSEFQNNQANTKPVAKDSPSSSRGTLGWLTDWSNNLSGVIAGPETMPESDYAPQIVANDLNPDRTDLMDDRLFLFVNNLSPGVYEYNYFLRALIPGRYENPPAKASELYFPEVFGRTSDSIFEVTK